MTYDHNNVFAKILRGELPCIKVYEDANTIAIMDIMPESKGHLLVITKEAAATFFDLSEEAAKACISTAKKIAPALMKVTKADGLIVSQFNHACSGQTVYHVHYHMVPKYINEANKAHAKEKGNEEEIKEIADALIKELAA